MVLGPDLWRLRALPDGGRTAAGLEPVASYVSLTELSEYAAGVPEEMKQARLLPAAAARGQAGVLLLPHVQAAGRPSTTGTPCDFDDRKALMMAHGAVGRTYHGRVLQVVTGSTGLDDWEWGVTLFGVHPDDLKDCVYQMRFDEASARYAEFGPFYTGMVAPRRGRRAGPAWPARARSTRRRAPRRRPRGAAGRAPPGPGGGGLQRRGRLGLPGQGGPRHLGPPRCCCVTAVSPSLAPEEEADCRALAAEWGLRWVGVPTDELDDPGVRGQRRRPLRPLQDGPDGGPGPAGRASGHRGARGQPRRPGRPPARARRRPRPPGRRFPLVDGRVHQGGRAAWSRRLGLRTWDKPAAACLASRLPYGTPVTLRHPALGGRAESALRALGLRASCGCATTVTWPASRSRRPTWPPVLARRAEVVAAVRAAGYAYVALDLEGFRSGSLNRVLAAPARAAGARIGASSHDPGAGQADLPRVAGAARRCWPSWSASSTSSPTSAGPTSRNTRGGSSARSTGSRPPSRPPWPGCGPRASRSTCWATCSRADHPPGPPGPGGVTQVALQQRVGVHVPALATHRLPAAGQALAGVAGPLGRADRGLVPRLDVELEAGDAQCETTPSG